MLREVGYIIGFTFAIIASIAHIFGFTLSLENQTSKSENYIDTFFSLCSNKLHFTYYAWSLFICIQASFTQNWKILFVHKWVIYWCWITLYTINVFTDFRPSNYNSPAIPI